MPAHPLLQPVGPRPPGVYWARRSGVLAVVIAAVVLVAYACSGGSGKPAQPRAASSPRPSPSPTATATSTALLPCVASQLMVSASTDAASYPAGVLPRLGVAIRTAGSPCTLPAGSVLWEVISGTDKVWTSVGCASIASKEHGDVRPNHPIRFGLIWDRHRSTPNCGPSGAAAGDGTYQLFVTVRGQKSSPAVFHLTG